jgi:thiol-disulfide isomerase/thioredoxin
MSLTAFFRAGLLLTVLFSVACGDRREATGSTLPVAALPVLRPAPAWTLRDVDGREVKSDDYKGKVVVVDFWATWCAPCRKEMPAYAALQKKYADRGLVILGFSLDDVEPVEVKRFGEQMNVGYRLVMANPETAESFGDFKGYLPTAYLIDRNGNIRHLKTGLSDMQAYEELIVSLL